MRPMQLDMLSEMDDAGSSMAMDVDDLEAMEILNEGGLISENKLADADFFNKFDDDFDDTDINWIWSVSSNFLSTVSVFFLIFVESM